MKSFSFFIYYSMIVDYDIIKKTHTHTQLIIVLVVEAGAAVEVVVEPAR